MAKIAWFVAPFKEERRADLTGRLFTYLTAIEKIGKTANGTFIYKCLCKCGKYVEVNANSLKMGGTKSCGCWMKERASERFSTHGLSGTRIYKIWSNMMGRCYCHTNSRFKTYGQRGITVCDRWHSFENFYEDMKDGYSQNLTLDRKLVNGNYEKENCQWIPRSLQSDNKTNTRYLEIDGIRRSVKEWASISGVKGRIILQRFDRYHWDAKSSVFGKEK